MSFDYAAHVEALARKHNVDVATRGRGQAYRRDARITIPPVRGQVSYLTALHEIGHVIGENPRLRLDKEVAAWEWALANAEVEPTAASWRSILRALRSYQRRGERSAFGTRLTDRFRAFVAYVEEQT